MVEHPTRALHLQRSQGQQDAGAARVRQDEAQSGGNPVTRMVSALDGEQLETAYRAALDAYADRRAGHIRQRLAAGRGERGGAVVVRAAGRPPRLRRHERAARDRPRGRLGLRRRQRSPDRGRRAGGMGHQEHEARPVQARARGMLGSF